MSNVRRDFLRQSIGVLVALSAGGSGIAVMGCEGDECGTSGKVTPGSDRVTVTSSCENGHTHDVFVTNAELGSPPAMLTRETSSYEGKHTHKLSLSQDELSQIQAGKSVTKESSNDNSHTHVFTLRKA